MNRTIFVIASPQRHKNKSRLFDWRRKENLSVQNRFSANRIAESSSDGWDQRQDPVKDYTRPI
jgi:hypothetical protein